VWFILEVALNQSKVVFSNLIFIGNGLFVPSKHYTDLNVALVIFQTFLSSLVNSAKALLFKDVGLWIKEISYIILNSVMFLVFSL